MICSRTPGVDAGNRRSPKLPGQLPAVRRLSDCESTNYLIFDALECGPGWDYTAGGASLLLVANGLDEKLFKEACAHVQVMFDNIQVLPTALTLADTCKPICLMMPRFVGAVDMQGKHWQALGK